MFPSNAIPKVGLPTPPGPSTLAPQGTFDCTFENGMCGWQQDQTDVSDWTIHSGALTSGPTGDHTKADGCKLNLKVYSIYIFFNITSACVFMII